VSSYRRDLARYTAFLTGRGVGLVPEVSPSDVSEFLMSQREGDADHPGLASGSAARTLVAVRGFHRFAVREGVSE
jgi:integrase/recombinase XerD